MSLEGNQNGAQTRITDANKTLWSQLNLTEPEEINYKSFDGMPIQGWIQKPPDFDPKKKYPLILDIHGDHMPPMLGLRSRISVDGGQGLRGALH